MKPVVHKQSEFLRAEKIAYASGDTYYHSLKCSNEIEMIVCRNEATRYHGCIDKMYQMKNHVSNS
jgi:hypothetical protein